ncbi:unnamed protein product [Strongylus vulgaris]|uniref:Uncharacterized protein n=1 Tax=Strongylus vulgaris TaxID=40348 RepID=A0A3P7IYW7_STRVU|nr:unnamed protein product [Strongylus vulgaris]
MPRLLPATEATTGESAKDEESANMPGARLKVMYGIEKFVDSRVQVT